MLRMHLAGASFALVHGVEEEGGGEWVDGSQKFYLSIAFLDH